MLFSWSKSNVGVMLYLPSERFTADLASPNTTFMNIFTGESGNPRSSFFLDQFPEWLAGTTLSLPLNQPAVKHTLTLTPR